MVTHEEAFAAKEQEIQAKADECALIFALQETARKLGYKITNPILALHGDEERTITFGEIEFKKVRASEKEIQDAKIDGLMRRFDIASKTGTNYKGDHCTLYDYHPRNFKYPFVYKNHTDGKLYKISEVAMRSVFGTGYPYYDRTPSVPAQTGQLKNRAELLEGVTLL